jgi:uncharacterized protein (TIGR03435 family)
MTPIRIRVVAIALTVALAAAASPAAQDAALGDLVIEVVSIKPTPAGTAGGSFGSRPGGGVVTSNLPMRSLIGLAYELTDANAIEGAPDWFFREGFDVNAKYAGQPTPEQTRAAWRAVFGDRFKLKARIDTREVPAFAVVLARPGQPLPEGMTRITTDCGALRAARQRGETPPAPPLTPAGATPCGSRYGGGQIVSSGMPIAQFVRSIQVSAGRVMIDRTGLEGDYEFTFQYATARPGGGPPDPDAGPDLFTALREQLGLAVEPTRTTSEFLIVEHIERPTPD